MKPKAQKIGRPEMTVNTPGRIGRKPTVIEGDTGLPVDTVKFNGIEFLVTPEEAALVEATHEPVGKLEPLPKWTEEDEAQ